MGIMTLRPAIPVVLFIQEAPLIQIVTLFLGVSLWVSTEMKGSFWGGAPLQCLDMRFRWDESL